MKKTLLGEVKAELIHLMKRQGELGVQEASQSLGLAVSTIRQHLVGLASEGWITDSSRRVGVGRPKKVYSLTSKADWFFQDREGFLLRRLLRFLITSQEAEVVDEFFETTYRELGAQWRAQIDFLPDHRRVPAILEVLEQWGYAPEMDRRDSNHLVVRFCHCPYSNVVEITDHPCQKEQELLGHLLRGAVQRDRYMPDGDTCCRFVIDLTECPKVCQN